MTSLFVINEAHSETRSATNLVFENRTWEAINAPQSRWPKELFVEPKTIRPSIKTLKMRIEAERKKPDIAEPIVLRLRTTELRPLLAQLANDLSFRNFTTSHSQNFSFLRTLERRIEKKKSETQDESVSKSAVAFLTLGPEDLHWLDLEKLSHALAYPSLDPFLPISEVRSLQQGVTSTLDRWNNHFAGHLTEVKNNVENWLQSNPNTLQMPLKEILPEHMRQLLGRYSPFRGRNCFATALQFAEPNIIQAKNINLVREVGHSLALINNDEFSHALWIGYDELRPYQVAAGLQYGDLVAFIDNEEGTAYTAFKHAAIHIASDIYLHKPSKSASTPIEFVRWKDLVQTWSPLVKRLDVRYFRRRSGMHIQERNSELSIEKIMWNR